MSEKLENQNNGGRVVPWAELGGSAVGAMTSQEALQMADIDWEVESREIYQNGLIIPGYKANVRTSDEKCLGIVSNRYKIVQNKDAFDFTDSLVKEGCQYERVINVNGGRKVILVARMPDQKILEEDYDPYLCFTNSHDGFGSIRAIITPVRVVCQNMMNLAIQKASRSWSIKHIGDINGKLEDARNTLLNAQNYMNEFEKTADILAHTKVSEDEVVKVLDELYPVNPEDSNRRIQNVNEIKDQFMICMFAPDILKYKGTAYGFVNAASDFATHVAPKRATPSYRENNLTRSLDGHVVIDTVFSRMMEKISM